MKIDSSTRQIQGSAPGLPSSLYPGARARLAVAAYAPAAADIARRAYLSYIERGMAPGNDLQHWLEAESQLIAEHRRSIDQGPPIPL